ncbi:uncharacterized protein LOC121249260 [Juglans microcarpa x Juglans regia]|uniref:uncharacterized protein LOC121249260 n=1 Tax=Juglans microcarpa x Juglans regia TaxID=2249226 RepID=UPI001B7EE182|nr:uncharacterized protein LOC121249260 [Juglans microcarpa x Juglans regia]
MGKEQLDLQFLGFFGIFKESIKLILLGRKIYNKIAVTSIILFSFTILAYIQFFDRQIFGVLNEEARLSQTSKNDSKHREVFSVASLAWTAILLLKVTYFSFAFSPYSLSIHEIAYTIACIYTAKESTITKVTIVVPKIGRRLATFFSGYAIMLLYCIVAAVLFLCVYIFVDNTIGYAIEVVLMVLYVIGFMYIRIIWVLANVLTVLEDVYGFQAMIKSKALIRGKMAVAIALFIFLSICLATIVVVFEDFVVLKMAPCMAIRLGVASLCFLFLLMVILFGLVVQTVIYFVCKSFHQEDIDMSYLAGHIVVDLEMHVPLKAKDIQVGELHV